MFFDLLEGKIALPYDYTNTHTYKCVNKGEATGELTGGNLSIITGLLGTPYLPDFENKILFLEDVGEPLYKIDRMLAQLKLCGGFDKISGLLFGEFTSMVIPNNSISEHLTPKELIAEFFQDVNIPIGYGFPCGHGFAKSHSCNRS
ncbi:MAG: LD-carboxypeptidase [Bacillus subtilis]|nr:LD-carboxypeptidase [Bacillus subtilis]